MIKINFKFKILILRIINKINKKIKIMIRIAMNNNNNNKMTEKNS